MIASAEIASNMAQIRAGIAAATEANAQVLLVPECALCGYPSAARADLAHLDGCALADAEDALMIEAEQAGIVLVLGSASPIHHDNWSNDALCGGAASPPLRYRKRCLTPIDEEHFQPGHDSILIDADGWRLGVSICFDVRFPDVWGDLVCAGADAIVHIAHMAGPDPDPGVKAQVIPAHYMSRAAEWVTPIVVCNTAAEDRWVDSMWIDGRGIILANTNSFACHSIPARDDIGPWYQGIYDRAIARHEKRCAN